MQQTSMLVYDALADLIIATSTLLYTYTCAPPPVAPAPGRQPGPI